MYTFAIKGREVDHQLLFVTVGKKLKTQMKIEVKRSDDRPPAILDDKQKQNNPFKKKQQPLFLYFIVKSKTNLRKRREDNL